MNREFINLCNKNELTVKELAVQANLSPRYLAKISTGQMQNIRLSVLVRLASELKTSVENLNEILSARPEDPILTTCIEIIKAPNFEDLLLQAFNALENNNSLLFQEITGKIRCLPKSKFPLKVNYLKWADSLKLGLQNKYSSALPLLLQAYNFRARSTVDKQLKSQILMGIGSIHLAMGRYNLALKFFRKSLLFRQRQQTGLIYINIGTLYRRMHQYSLAINSYENALKTDRLFIKILARAGIGQVYLDSNNLACARTHLLKGYVLINSNKSERGNSELLCNLGQYYKTIGKPNRAIMILEKGLTSSMLAKNQRAQLYIYKELINLYMEIGDSRAVCKILTVFDQTTIDEGDVLLGVTGVDIAKIYKTLGNSELSRNILINCYKSLSKAPPSIELANCCSLLTEYYNSVHDPSLVEFYLNESKRIKKYINNRSKRNGSTVIS